jgi:hypothetical protein
VQSCDVYVSRFGDPAALPVPRPVEIVGSIRIALSIFSLSGVYPTKPQGVNTEAAEPSSEGRRRSLVDPKAARPLLFTFDVVLLIRNDRKLPVEREPWRCRLRAVSGRRPPPRMRNAARRQFRSPCAPTTCTGSRCVTPNRAANANRPHRRESVRVACSQCSPSRCSDVKRGGWRRCRGVEGHAISENEPRGE